LKLADLDAVGFGVVFGLGAELLLEGRDLVFVLLDSGLILSNLIFVSLGVVFWLGAELLLEGGDLELVLADC